MKKNIVIVDDFENTLWILEFTLKNINCEILKAANGKEALSYFDGRRIDLLLTDLNMPQMNGLELVKEVKSNIYYRKLPVVLLTTEKNPEYKAKAAELNITTWIQKPFKSDDFMKIIKRCLQIA